MKFYFAAQKTQINRTGAIYFNIKRQTKTSYYSFYMRSL